MCVFENEYQVQSCLTGIDIIPYLYIIINYSFNQSLLTDLNNPCIS